MLKNLIENRKLKITIVTVCRLLLGITFVVFGFIRAFNPVMGARMVSDYIEAAGMTFFQPLSTPLAIIFAAAEFAIGICSLLGTNIRQTSLYTVLLLGFLTPFSFYTAFVSPVTGNHQMVGLPTSDRASFWLYVVWLTTAILIFIWRKYSKSVFSNRIEWAIGPISLAFSICVSLTSYIRLPMVDLSPYRTGTNLRYFSIDEQLTKDDVQWDENELFNTKQKHSTVTPEGNPIAALQIYSEDKGDITREITGYEGYTFLLVAEDLRKASTSARHEINDLYDYARDNNYRFFCLTATKKSSNITEEYCVESGGAEYPIVNADRSVLSNMIQANPGLLLLKNGTIYRKWSYFELPTFEDRLENSENASLQTQSMRKKFISTLGDFAIILMIILALDKFVDLVKWAWRRLSTKADAKEKGREPASEPEKEPESTDTGEMQTGTVAGNK